MALITLASLTGSPGVTTTAVGMTMSWWRPALLVEADTSKTSSILPGFFQGQVHHTHGLSNLSIAQQRGLTEFHLKEQSIPMGERRLLIPGFNNVVAAQGTTALWEPLARVLASLDAGGLDVLVDLGRLGLADTRAPLIQAADSVLIVLRPVLPDISAVAARIGEVRRMLEAAGRADHLNLLLIDTPHQRYSAREIHQVTGVDVVAEVRHDPTGAAVFSLGATSGAKSDRTPYRRSLGAAQSTIAQRIIERNNQLGTRPYSPREEASA